MNTCDFIPYPSTPGTVTMDVNGANVSWTQSDPYYFNMTGTATDYSVRLGGSTAAPFMNQTCDVSLINGNEIKGECSYGVFEGVTSLCRGEWSFKGTRQGMLP